MCLQLMSQFFTTEILDVCEMIADKKKRILAGLDMDFQGEPFGIMPQLLAIANTSQRFK